MRTVSLAIATVVLTSACTHQLDVVNPSDVAGREVTVDTGRGTTETGTVSRDGRVIHTLHGDVDLGDVRTITVTRRWRGALEGAAIGALVLFPIPAALAYSEGDDKCGEGLCILPFTAGEKAALAGGAAAMIGSVIGSIIGAVRGGHDVYDLGGTEAPLPRVIPSGPPGSVAGFTMRF